MLTSKCASRQSGAHFLKISSSKSAPNPSVFNTFDLDRCCAPQRRALFDISTSKSCPELRCFVHFDFEMCFAQQRRAIFHLSSGQMAPHLPLSRAYTILFNPTEPQIIGKTYGSRLFYLFAHLHLLPSDSFSSLTFSLLLFSSLTLPTSPFPSVHIHIVRSLTTSFDYMILYAMVRNVMNGYNHVANAATTG